MAELMQQGGPTMMLILMLVLPGLAFAVLHIVLRRKWTLLTAVGVLALILAIGLFGRWQGRTRTELAIGNMREADRAEILAAGYEESSRPLQLAGIVDGILAVGVVIGELRRRRA